MSAWRYVGPNAPKRNEERTPVVSQAQALRMVLFEKVLARHDVVERLSEPW
jgi:hypothetical protein